MAKLKSYAGQTHQGPYLEVNEDAMEIDLVHNLFMIVDGFGGSNIGDKAALTVVNTVKNFYTKIGGDPDSTLPFYHSQKYLLEGNALVNSMQHAHMLIRKENSEKEMSQRGGASAIIGALSENLISFASTGNCISFLFRKGKLEILTTPDSDFSFTNKEFQGHFKTNPLSGFGLFEDLHFTIKEKRVAEGDVFLLMTDGAFSRIDEEELLYILNKSNKRESEQIEEVFNLANGRGNLDNQTILMLNF